MDGMNSDEETDGISRPNVQEVSIKICKVRNLQSVSHTVQING